MSEVQGHPRVRMVLGSVALFISVSLAIWFLIIGPRQQQIDDLHTYVHELEQKQ
jgi:hypothetical protein